MPNYRAVAVFAFALATAIVCGLFTSGCNKTEPVSVDVGLTQICNEQNGTPWMLSGPCRIECMFDDGHAWKQRIPDETCVELKVAP